MVRPYRTRTPQARLLDRDKLRKAIMDWCVDAGLFPDAGGWQRGMTARFAAESDLSRSMIGHLLRGDRKSCAPEFAEPLAAALGVPVATLFLITAPSSTRRDDMCNTATETVL